MDLRLGWDQGIEADQVKLPKTLSFEKPHLFISSPMCLASFQLQALNTKPDRLAELVLFYHPSAATSWNEPCLRKLLTIDGMRRVRCDQCQFGMTHVDVARPQGS